MPRDTMDKVNMARARIAAEERKREKEKEWVESVYEEGKQGREGERERETDRQTERGREREKHDNERILGNTLCNKQHT